MKMNSRNQNQENGSNPDVDSQAATGGELHQISGGELQKLPTQGTPQKSAMETLLENSSNHPKRRKRAKPGTKGEGEYFRINVRPKDDFVSFRYQDVGDKGHILRLAGKRSSGSWDTQVWLISKEDAHIDGDALVADTKDASNLLESLGSKPKKVKEDVFEAKDRPNIPERNKPTVAQQSARLKNIKKAQQARQ